MLVDQLQEVKARLNQAQAQRDKIVDQGRRAYMMGIELRDNPRNAPSERTLWEEGWKKEARDFTAKLDRWKRN